MCGECLSCKHNTILQPQQYMASRGAEDEHDAENKKFVLKATITAFKGIKEVLVNGLKGIFTIEYEIAYTIL